jgi:hypothetical protein
MAFHEFHIVVAVDTTFSATARALVKDFVEEVASAHYAMGGGALLSRGHGVPPGWLIFRFGEVSTNSQFRYIGPFSTGE